MMKKPDAAVNLVKNALSKGIQADYDLMDTWFTNEPMIKTMLNEGIDIISMVKNGNYKYRYNAELCDLKQLKKSLPKVRNNSILGSVVNATKAGIPVKIVFVANRTNGLQF